VSDCNGNGFCVDSDTCVCKGQWTGDDCANSNSLISFLQTYLLSLDECSDGDIQNSDLDVLNRILAGEALLKLAKKLSKLLSKLEYIKDNLPAYNDLLSCMELDAEIRNAIREILLISYGSEENSLNFLECMTDPNAVPRGLLPVLSELKQYIQLLTK
jgi:hypothetical protein